jgi:hypothetical protein
MLCPHCKKGEMEEKSVVTGILDSNSDTRTELICNVCRHKLVEMDVKESLNLDEKIESEKT